MTLKRSVTKSSSFTPVGALFAGAALFIIGGATGCTASADSAPRHGSAASTTASSSQNTSFVQLVADFALSNGTSERWTGSMEGGAGPCTVAMGLQGTIVTVTIASAVFSRTIEFDGSIPDTSETHQIPNYSSGFYSEWDGAPHYLEVSWGLSCGYGAFASPGCATSFVGRDGVSLDTTCENVALQSGTTSLPSDGVDAGPAGDETAASGDAGPADSSADAGPSSEDAGPTSGSQDSGPCSQDSDCASGSCGTDGTCS